jgi:hypothetical protein
MAAVGVGTAVGLAAVARLAPAVGLAPAVLAAAVELAAAGVAAVVAFAPVTDTAVGALSAVVVVVVFAACAGGADVGAAFTEAIAAGTAVALPATGPSDPDVLLRASLDSPVAPELVELVLVPAELLLGSLADSGGLFWSGCFSCGWLGAKLVWSDGGEAE